MPAFGKLDPAKKKNIMEVFTMKEISSVTAGAQEGALAVIMKTAPLNSSTPGLIEKVALLTSVHDGHQHLVELTVEALKEGGGTTRWASSGKKDEYEHSHAFIINDDGTITVATDKGHTHTLEASELLGQLKAKALLNAVVEAAVGADDNTPNVDVYVDVYKSIEIDGKVRKLVPSDFALVGNIHDSNTWHYPLSKTQGGRFCNQLLGHAVNALKGDRVPAQEVPHVVRKVRKAWKKANPSKAINQLPKVLKQTF